MAKARKIKMPETLWDKVKKVDETFAAAVYSMQDDELKKNLVEFANQQQIYEDEKERDTDLRRLTEEKKTASETYDVPLKAIKLKRKLTIQTLRERGKLSDQK